MLRLIVDFCTSLKLTVVALALAMILVFVGTLAQVDQGLYLAQNNYFRSFFVWWAVPGVGLKIPVLPGGYLIGFVLLINLVCAQLRRLDFSRRNFGIYTVHVGLIILLLGQLATDLLQVESHMRLSEGESKNYSESGRLGELAIIDTSNPGFDEVVAIPENILASQSEIRSPHWSFSVKIKKFYRNSRVADANPQEGSKAAPVSQGLGKNVQVEPAPPTVSMDERNIPSAIIEVQGAQGSLGTWLASLALTQPQSFTVDGHLYQMALRPVRYYKPFYLQLVKFRHDKYKGSEIPKNFSSQVRLRRPATAEDREVLIYMNNPLRYAGETYYQSGYDERDPRVTILQVVRNPGWLTPYLACILVSAGLVIQFMTHLVGFAAERRTA